MNNVVRCLPLQWIPTVFVPSRFHGQRTSVKKEKKNYGVVLGRPRYIRKAERWHATSSTHADRHKCIKYLMCRKCKFFDVAYEMEKWCE